MPANPTTLHIPVVFDVSGGATLFAESQPEDFVENHLQFTLDSAADSNGNTLTAADFSQCIYVGDQDQGDSLFYQSAESGRTVRDLSKKIANAIINGTLKNDIADTAKRVPKGGGSVDSTGEASFYNGGITDSNGTHFGPPPRPWDQSEQIRLGKLTILPTKMARDLYSGAKIGRTT